MTRLRGCGLLVITLTRHGPSVMLPLFIHILHSRDIQLVAVSLGTCRVLRSVCGPVCGPRSRVRLRFIPCAPLLVLPGARGAVLFQDGSDCLRLLFFCQMVRRSVHCLL